MGYRKRQEGKPHLDFILKNDTGKTCTWWVESTHPTIPVLGRITWYWAWRRYIFYPEEGTFFDAECLVTIATFMAKEMKKRKEK